MRSLYNFYPALTACFLLGAVVGSVHAQLSADVTECGDLERRADQGIPLSKRERIELRQEEINDMVNQVETCTDKSGQGAGSGSGSGNGSGSGSEADSSGEGFSNGLEDGEQSVTSNTLKGNNIPTNENSQLPPNATPDEYALESGTQDPASDNGANQEALKKVDNNERLRRQLEAKIESEKDPAVRAALEQKLKDLKK